MDPSTRLDHTLFQLTPTRTRCDLVIAGGGLSERLASGLLEPFLSHLKSAKDQISKGGYSITLRPPGPHSPWFTKSTLQRFVRFVSTPEVLERIVTIEKEIVQIERNLVADADGNLSFADGRKKSTTNQDGHEENSRVRLQRVLDNRKAMLCKEQAMAYARALVAGYYLESLDDLICFADAFGASRLRQACIDFLDLCKQKNEDKLWMDEIAAMQASSRLELPYLRTSGIILAGEEDAGSKLNGDASISESTPSHASFDMSQDNSMPKSAQTPPMSWPNHVPQYFHNFQGQAFQHMAPPFQGYIYPGMQFPSSYYPGNMQWPPNAEDLHNALDRETDYNKSSLKKKKKKKHPQVLDHSEEEDASTASSDSSYETDSDEHSRQGKKHSSTENQHKKKKKKKHGQKSSRKVVIRNINYITSKGDGEKGSSITEGSSSNDEGFIGGDSLKQQVEEAVGSLERRQNKSNNCRHKKQNDANHPGTTNGLTSADHWDAFQNLLLRDDESGPDAEKQLVRFEEEYFANKNPGDERSNGFKTGVVSNDSFILTGGELDGEGQNLNGYFKEGKDVPPFMKKKDRTNEELLFSQRNNGESGHYSVSTRSGFGLEHSITKCQKEEDWMIINQSDKPANENGHKSFGMFNVVSVSSLEKNKKDVLADDSFMIQARSSENHFNSHSAVELSLVSDIVGASEYANSTQEVSHTKTKTSNSHEPDDLFMVLDRDSAVEQNAAAPWSMEMDYENNVLLNEANRKLSDVETDKKQPSNGESANTKAPGARTGKVVSKDAKSKALNASSIGRSKPGTMSRTKASPGSKTTITKSKSEKEEESRKRKEELLIQRQKRIAERSSAKKTGTGTKTSLTSAKKEKPKINPANEEAKKLRKPVLRSSTIDRLATARVTQKKVSPTKKIPTPTKKPSLKVNEIPMKKTTAGTVKKQGSKDAKSSNKKEGTKKANGEVLADTKSNAKNEAKALVVLPVNSGAAEQSVVPNINNSGLNDGGVLSTTSLPNHDHAIEGTMSRGEDVMNKLSSLPGDKPQHVIDVIVNPTAPSLPIKPLTASALNTSKVNQEIEESDFVSAEVPKIQISTPPPPPSDQVMPETNHSSRKKWNNEEDSSKAAKGFRKLLFFGRKS